MGRTAESECNVELWRSSDVVPGTIFSRGLFLWTHFSLDHFFRGPFFRGPFFRRPFFRDHFSAYQIYCIETQDSEFAIDGECFWSRKWKEEKNWKSCQMCCHPRKKTSLGESLAETHASNPRARQASPQILGSDYMHGSPQDSLRESFFYAGIEYISRLPQI